MVFVRCAILFCINLYRNTNDAEDLFQDTWLKTSKYMDKFNRAKSFKPWLFTIAVNLYKDNYRKAKRWFLKSLDSFYNDETTIDIENLRAMTYLPEEEYYKNQDKQNLRSAVKQLKSEYRIVILLFYYNELKQKEISEVLKIPEGTVKSRLNKAKKLLKEYMEDG